MLASTQRLPRAIFVSLDSTQRVVLGLRRNLNTCCSRIKSSQSVHSSLTLNFNTLPTAKRRFSSARFNKLAAISPSPKYMINDLKHQELLVAFNDNHTVRYPSFWLRDHCPCSTCTHPHTRQRQVDTFSIDPDIKAAQVESTPEGLQVTWPDDHISTYQWEWLSEHTPFSVQPDQVNPRAEWTHVSPAAQELPSVNYTAVMNGNAGLAEFLRQIRVYGLSFVRDTPATPEATERLLQRIAFIRHTHYGGFWDFTSEAKPIDTAYTNLELPAHTDNTYFTDPGGLQMFHCLKTANGGESTFVDGFAAATELYRINQDYYNVLSSVRIVSHASGDAKVGSIMNNAAHSGGFPVFSHSVPHVKPSPRNLSQIRWNNDDRHSSTQWLSHERMIMWYRAARLWKHLLESKEFEVQVQLTPGTPVIFDNWRVLHGRKAFEGQRRICGGYIGMDDFLARERAVLLDQGISS